MKVYALIADEPDTYDIGTHDAVLDLFSTREGAELVAAELSEMEIYPYSGLKWSRDRPLRVEEWEVR